MAVRSMLSPPSVGDPPDGYSEEGDELILATIDQRIHQIGGDYAIFAAAVDDDSYEEVSEDEEGLDLTAPPPES